MTNLMVISSQTDQNRSETMISTHRFGDSVAVYAEHDIDRGTTYLSVKDARRFAAAMLRICRSVEREKFTDSRNGLTFSATPDEARNIVIARIA